MNIHKNLLYLFGILSLAGLVASGLFLYQYFAKKHFLELQAYNNVKGPVENAKVQLEQRFAALVHSAHSVSEWINTHRFDDQAYKQFVAKVIGDNKDIFGVVLGFVPFAHDKEKRLFPIYYVREGEEVKLRPLTYDYTLPSAQAGARTEWYLDAIKYGQVWSEPFYGTSSKQHVATYTERFYSFDDEARTKPIGAVGIVVSLDYLRSIINSFELGAFGYGFVISRKGIYAAHPIENYYLKEQSMFDIARENHSSSLLQIAQEIISRHDGTISYIDDISGQKATLFYKTISHTNFMMAATFLNNELLAPYAKQLRFWLMLLIISIIFTLCLICLFAIILWSTSSRIVFSILIGVSMILAGGIVAIWAVELSNGGNANDYIMPSQSKVNKFIEQFKTNEPAEEPIIPVKTGFLIRSIRYMGGSQIYLVGLLWQRYPVIKSQSLKYDFYMSDCERFFYKDRLAQFRQNDEDVVVWQISGLFNQTHFSSQNFPFDRQNVSLSISYPDLQRRVLLVPDMATYQFTSPRLLPGLRKDVNIEGKTLLQSYFTIRKDASDLSAGKQKIQSLENHYDLYFVVITERLLIGVLLGYLLPVLVALLFLMAIPFFATKTFTTSMQTVAACAGIFMAMSFSHSSMRKTIIETGGLSYLEYYYVFLYILICIIIMYIILSYIVPRKSMLARDPKPVVVFSILPLYLFVNFIVTILTFFN